MTSARPATLLLLALACAAALAGCGGGKRASTPRPAARLAPAGDIPASTTRALVAELGAIQTDATDWPSAIPAGGTRAWRTVIAGRAAALRAQLSALLPAVPVRHGGGPDAAAHAELTYLRALIGQVRAQTLNPAAATLVADEVATRAADMQARLQGNLLSAMGPGTPARRIRTLDRALFRARLALAEGGDTAAATAALRHARGLPGIGPDLGAARRAAAAGDAIALGAARGRIAGALAVAAYRNAVAAARANDPAALQKWLAARDLGPGAGRPAPATGAVALERDQLNAFQQRALALVQRAGLAAYRHADADRAQDAAWAAQYWSVLAAEAKPRVGAPATAATTRALRSLTSLPAAAPAWRIDSAVQGATRTLSAFTAAPLSAGARAARVEQLIRYARFESGQICGLSPNVTSDAADAASVAPTLSRIANDIAPGLAPASAAKLRRAVSALAQLPTAAGVGIEDVPSPTSVSPEARRLCATADAALRAVFPREWRTVGESADFDAVERYLDRMVAAARDHDYASAEAARARAYAAFEFGAELRLRAYDPAAASRIEGLFWAGAPGGPDLVSLIAHKASAAKLAARRKDVTTALEQGRITLQRSRGHAATMLNSAVVVFREGLEAALILAALSASFATGGRRWRRPLVVGMIAALPATLVTWIVTSAIVRSLASFGLQLEAGLDLVAFAVLAIIMAWFFQRFCWTRFVAKTHARNRRFLRRRDGSELVAASVALAVFGFMVIYREGFETVVYLQALKLGAAGGAVLAGALLGLAVTIGLALLMLRLRRRLPYRRIVVVTAVAIGVLLVIMAGQGARAFQGAGWLGITPLEWHIPLWAGQWLGIYPSVETLMVQLLTALAIPLGAELIRRRRDRRLQRIMAARKRPAARPAATAVSR